MLLNECKRGKLLLVMIAIGKAAEASYNPSESSDGRGRLADYIKSLPLTERQNKTGGAKEHGDQFIVRK
jgi:hypothetical protein